MKDLFAALTYKAHITEERNESLFLTISGRVGLKEMLPKHNYVCLSVMLVSAYTNAHFFCHSVLTSFSYLARELVLNAAAIKERPAPSHLTPLLSSGFGFAPSAAIC